MSNLQDSWDGVVNANENEKPAKLDSFLQELVLRGQASTHLRDAISVGNVLANILLERIAAFVDGREEDQVEVDCDCIQYMSTSGFSLLHALAHLSCEGVLCHHELAVTLLEQFAVCTKVLSEGIPCSDAPSLRYRLLPAVDEWCTRTEDHGVELLASCIHIRGEMERADEVWQAYIPCTASLLLLCVQGISLENAYRHPPQWGAAVSQQLSDLCQALRQWSLTVSDYCRKCRPLADTMCFICGVLARVVSSIFHTLSQYAACAQALQELTVLPELVSLASAMLDCFTTMTPSLPLHLETTMDILHSVTIILSMDTPLPSVIPLVRQLIESDGLDLVRRVIESYGETLCVGLFTEQSPAHRVPQLLLRSIVDIASCLQLPRLGFPASASSRSNVSSALVQSAADSDGCLSSKLMTSLLTSLSCCTCSRTLAAVVPLLPRLVPCLCISSHTWLCSLLDTFKNCLPTPGLSQQVLLYLLQSLRRPPISHAILNFGEGEVPGSIEGYVAEQSGAWPHSLEPYLVMVQTSSLAVALPLLQHLASFADCAAGAQRKLCWQVAVPLLKAVSETDVLDDAALLQAALLMCAKILVTATDQERFLESFPWQVLFEKWLGHPVLHLYTLPLCGILLSVSVEQVLSHSATDDCVTKLGMLHPGHRLFLAWMVKRAIWCPESSDGVLATWDRSMLCSSSCLTVVLSQWIHSALIKQMFWLAGGPEVLMSVLSATLAHTHHLVATDEQQQSTAESADATLAQGQAALLEPLVNRSVAVLRLLSAIMCRFGDADQEIASGLDGLAPTFLSLCKLPNALLVPLTTTLVQLATFSAHSTWIESALWPGWPSPAHNPPEDVGTAARLLADDPASQASQSSSPRSRHSPFTSVQFDVSHFFASTPPASDVSDSVATGSVSADCDGEGYDGDVDSDDEQAAHRAAFVRTTSGAANQSILAEVQEPVERLQIPELARLLTSMASRVQEVCISQMLLGSLSHIASGSSLNGAAVTELKLAEHCLECFAPMFASPQQTGLEESVLAFLVILCKWQTTSETLYRFFRLISNSECMQNRLLLLTALTELVDLPYHPSHAVAFQLGVQPSPHISNQIETLGMDMESCASWPRNGLSFVLRCCLQVDGLSEREDSVFTWFLISVGSGRHDIQLAVDSFGSILVWYRWKDKQTGQKPLEFPRLLKFGIWYHIGCVLEFTKKQATITVYLNGVSMGSKPVPDWSASFSGSTAASQSASSVYCEIGTECTLLVPPTSPDEASTRIADNLDNDALVIDGQEAFVRAVSCRSIDSATTKSVYSTLQISSALVFDTFLSELAMFALYGSGFTSVGLDNVVLYKGTSGHRPSWLPNVHASVCESWWAHMNSVNKLSINPELWSFAESQSLMNHLCMGYTATSPSHWFCFHCQSSSHSCNGTVPARITGGLPRSSHHSHIKDSVLALGGMRALLYLAALCASWDTERKCDGHRLLPHAMHLIFSLTKSHSGNWLDLSQCSGHHLLRQVMLTGRYSADTNSLRILLNSICDKPVVYFSDEGTLVVLPGCDAIIVRPQFIEAVLLEWRVWSKAAGVESWYASLQTLLALISESHPHSVFNIEQCQKADVLRLLINASRDYPRESNRPVPDPIVRTIDSMITVFLGSPPDMAVLGTLCDFLLNERNNSVIHNIPAHLLNPLHGGVAASVRVGSGGVAASGGGGSGGGQSSGLPLSTSTPGRHVKTRIARTPRRNLSRNHPIKKLSASLFEVASEGGDEVQPNGQSDDGFRALNSGADSRVDSTAHSTASRAEADLLDAKPPNAGPLDLAVRKSSQDSDVFTNRKPSFGRPLSLPVSHLTAGSTVFKNDGGSSHSSGDDEVAGVPASAPVQGDSFLFSTPTASVPPPNFGVASEKTSTYDIPDLEELKVLTPSRLHRTPRSVRHYGDGGGEVTSSLEARILTQLHNNMEIVADTQLQAVLPLLPAEALLLLADNDNICLRTAVVKTVNVMLARGGKQFLQTMIELRGFHLLANQLVRHSVSEDLMNACWSLFLKAPTNIVDSSLVFLRQAAETGDVVLDAVVPLLVLLPLCVPGHMTACYNSLLSLRVLLAAVNGLCERMLQNGLVDFLTKILLAVHKFSLSSRPSSICDHLALAIRHFVSTFVIDTCSTAGHTSFSMFEEFVSHIAALEKMFSTEEEEDGGGRIQCLRSVHYFLITSALQVFSGNSQVCPPPPLNWQENVPSFPSHEAGSESIGSLRRHMSLQHLPMANKTELCQRLMQVCLMGANLACSAEDCFRPLLARTLSRGFSLTVTPTPTEDASQDSPTKSRAWKQTIKEDSELVVNNDESGSVPFIATIFGVESVAAHRQFVQMLFRIFVDIIMHFLPPKRTINTDWAQLCRQAPGVRQQCARLAMCILHPLNAARDRSFFFDQLADIKPLKPFFEQLLSTSLSHKLVGRLILYTRQLLRHHGDELNEEQEACAHRVLRLSLDTGYSLLPGVTKLEDLLRKSVGSLYQPLVIMAQTERQWRHQERQGQDRWWDTHCAVLQQIRAQSRQLHQSIDSYSRIAQDRVFSRQRQVEWMLLDATKASLDQLHRTVTLWRHLVNIFCHTRALFNTPMSWPHHWQIDPTEAPNRTRLRMQPCFLEMEDRFLLPERRKGKLAMHPCKNELLFLFNSQHSLLLEPGSANRGLLDPGDIIINLSCTSITPGHATVGEILIGGESVYFVGEESQQDTNLSAILQGSSDVQCHMWQYTDILEILCRRYNLKDNAMELFLASNRTVLLAFESKAIRDEAFHKLMSLNLPNLMDYNDSVKGSFLRQSIKQRWQEGYLSNFEYLTHLNKLAGRSFNDLMQYPVFPFILADYSSISLDLTDPASFRDLSKPIAVQDETKVQKYREKYDYMDHEYRNVEPSERMHHWTPYHYGSHYSNAGIVLHFLVRVMPYTTLFLDFQDHNFDIPDRTFHNVHTTWKLASSLSSSDVKELIPEFYFLPEFLLNNEGFAFGVRQDEHVVHDVQLPPWANNNARTFILKHREALESEYVSQHLHLWIDLIFGWKQTGQAAKDSVNVFHPATYSGMDISSISDPVRRRAVEQMIRTYGQTPSQLFTSAHPARYVGSTSILGVQWSRLTSPTTSLEVIFQTQASHRVTGISLSSRGEVVDVMTGVNHCQLALHWNHSTVACDVTWLWCDGRVSISAIDETLSLASRASRRTAATAQLCLPALRNGHQFTCCAATAQGDLLMASTDGLLRLVALGGGKRRLWKQQFNLDVGGCLLLAGHYCSITAMAVSRAYGVCVTGDEHGRCILWDLNRFMFIRSLPEVLSPVSCLAISTTLGDITCASSVSAHKALITCWTINGQTVNQRSVSSRILCLAYSSATEGVNVNVLAAGLQEGVVRLFSSWDLSVIRDIPLVSPPFNPITVVVFSSDSQNLYAGDGAGNVRGWSVVTPGL